MIADMEADKKLNPIVTEMFIMRGRKLNISDAFISQSYFKMPKDIRSNAKHYFIIKISKKREIQQIAFNDSSVIDFKHFTKLYKDYTKEPPKVLMNDATYHQENR